MPRGYPTLRQQAKLPRLQCRHKAQAHGVPAGRGSMMTAKVRERPTVQVWTLDLDQVDHLGRTWDRYLSVDERARSRRFANETLRRRWVRAHGGLRVVLAGRIACDPASLRFRQGPYGKPEIDHPTSSLRFNLSRSRGLALVGITRGIPLGIDIEHVRPIPEMDDIAEARFSAAERTTLRNLPAPARLRAFFACWTRKEAYVKALGLGLSADLASFDVSLHPDQNASLLAIEGSRETAKAWSLIHFEPKPGYIGALALRCPGPINVDWSELTRMRSAH